MATFELEGKHAIKSYMTYLENNKSEPVLNCEQLFKKLEDDIDFASEVLCGKGKKLYSYVKII